MLFRSIMVGVLAPSLMGCNILPKEEVFQKEVVIKEFETEEFSMTTVMRGDVCDYERIACIYKESNLQVVELDEWVMIEKVNVEVGDRVEVGDVLVTQMSGDIDSELDDYRYQIKLREAELQQLTGLKKLAIERQKLILDDEVSILAIEENYDMQIEQCRSAIEMNKNYLKTRENLTKEYQVTADISGKVTYVNEKAESNGYGEWGSGFGRMGGSRGKRIVTVSDGTMPYFITGIDSSDLIKDLDEGQMLNIVYGDQIFETTVHFPEEDEQVVQFVMDYYPEDIETGNQAYGKYIKAESKDVLYLPKSAVNKMGDSYVVYLEDENGLKNVREIEIGLMADNKVEIKSGLEFGDAVIVR